jgi:4-hydroxybenzoate polyprenyltransferase
VSTTVRTASSRETPPRTPSLLRAVRIVHPFPTLLNVVATTGLVFVASDGGPNAGMLVRMLLVMFFAQCAIGITNDLFDRELDARTKPWKPLVAGLLSARTAVGLAVLCIVVSGAVAVSLGAASLGLAALGTACGLAYDVRLKRTLLSAVPYMIAIPTLPLWVYVTLGRWEAVLWWLLPLAGLIGLALHLANTLPDIESDAAHGVRGLAHRLGMRGSMFVSWAAFAGALALAVVIGPFVDADVRWYAATLGAGIGCLVVAVCAYGMRGEMALRVNFAAMSIGAAVTAVGWLAAVT